jgi:hypothetical protein
VVGEGHSLSTSLFGLARINPDGTLDASFGSGGVLTTTINGNEAVQAIVIQPDGRSSPSATRRTTRPASPSPPWPATTPNRAG